MLEIYNRNSNILIALKRTQLALAIATTVSVIIVFFPSVEVFLASPLCLLYMLWALRAMNDKRLSMWLACLTTLSVALVLSAVTFKGGFRAFTITVADVGVVQPLAFNTETGKVEVLDSLPAAARATLPKRQESAVIRFRVATTFLLLLTLGAWAAVLMHATQWRWLVAGKHPCNHSNMLSR